MKKLYVIRKYIMATNAKDAMRKEKHVKPDECWIDEKWRDANPELDQKKRPIGFSTSKQ